MRKIFIPILIGLFILSLTATPLKAGDKAMEIFLHGGIVTDDSLSFEPMLWTAGVNIDFHLGSMLMLSPEAMVVVYKFEFDPIWIAPGCLLNVKLGSFFAGGGLTKWFLVGDGYTVSTDIALKLNAGFRGSNMKITAFAVMNFDNMFSDMTVGATFAIGF